MDIVSAEQLLGILLARVPVLGCPVSRGARYCHCALRDKSSSVKPVKALLSLSLILSLRLSPLAPCSCRCLTTCWHGNHRNPGATL